MKPRLNIAAVSAGAYHAMLGLEKYIHEGSIDEAPVNTPSSVNPSPAWPQSSRRSFTISGRNTPSEE